MAVRSVPRTSFLPPTRSTKEDAPLYGFNATTAPISGCDFEKCSAAVPPIECPIIAIFCISIRLNKRLSGFSLAVFKRVYADSNAAINSSG